MTRDLATEFVTDRTGIAFVLGVSVNHVNKLVSRGLPRRARGQYDIADCVQWAISDATTRSGVDPDEMPAVVAARTRLYEAQYEHKELETARLRGELLDADEVRESMLELAHVLVGALEGLPARAAQEVASKNNAAEAAAVIREHCNATRHELAARVRSLAFDADDDGEADSAAPDADGCAVGGRRAPRGTTGEPAPGAVAD